jgi:hypothetical protein
MDILTPKEVGAGNDIMSSVKAIQYYSDVLLYGESTSDLTRGLPIKPTGKNEFIRTGQKCSNGQDMYVYVKGIPESKGGLPMKGLVPGFLQDARYAFDVNALLDTMTNNAYPECKEVEMPVGAVGSKSTEKRWVESARISKKKYDCTICKSDCDKSCAFENFTDKTPVTATAITLCILVASYFLFCKK